MVGGRFFRRRVLGIRPVAQAAFHGGKGKDGLRREMNLRLGQERPFQPEHRGADSADHEPGDEQGRQDRYAQQHKPFCPGTRRHYLSLPLSVSAGGCGRFFP